MLDLLQVVVACALRARTAAQNTTNSLDSTPFDRGICSNKDPSLFLSVLTNCLRELQALRISTSQHRSASHILADACARLLSHHHAAALVAPTSGGVETLHFVAASLRFGESTAATESSAATCVGPLQCLSVCPRLMAKLVRLVRPGGNGASAGATCPPCSGTNCCQEKVLPADQSEKALAAVHSVENRSKAVESDDWTSSRAVPLVTVSLPPGPQLEWSWVTRELAQAVVEFAKRVCGYVTNVGCEEEWEALMVERSSLPEAGAAVAAAVDLLLLVEPEGAIREKSKRELNGGERFGILKVIFDTRKRRHCMLVQLMVLDCSC